MRKNQLLFYFSFLLYVSLSAQEICNNAIDDDADGLIDLNDSVDCFCSIEKKYEKVPSLIPNPSFEIMDSCTDAFAQVDRAKGWKQATDATSDLYNMGCPWHGFLNHQPVPDGSSFVGCAFSSGWQEYVGACLSEPLRAGTEYELVFNLAGFATTGGADTIWKNIKYASVDVTLFGTTSCPKFPLTNVTPITPTAYFLECPVEKGWKVIGSVRYSFDTLWGELSMKFTPTEDFYSVMLGPPCNVNIPRLDTSSESGYAYILFDNLILNKTSVFNAHQIIESKGSFCKHNLELTAHPIAKTGKYQWYKNGITLVGETDTILKISVKAYGTGKYSFVLTLGAASHNCAISSFVVMPSTYAKITAVSASNTTLCKNEKTLFIATSSLANSTCKWKFGDGDSAVTYTTSHVYKNSGTYSVKFTLISPEGCNTDTSIVILITQHDLPTIKFAISNREGCVPYTASFTNNSTLSNTCLWSFGDGISSTNCSISHTYSNTGQFNGKLTFTSNQGCIKDSIISKMIEVYNNPTADFSFNPSLYFIPSASPVTFTNQSSNATSYLWKFGEGKFATEKNPSTTYGTTGEHLIKLISISSKGCKDSVEKIIQVKDKGFIEFPTAFIPNKEFVSSGAYDIINIKNDVFFSKHKSVKEYTLQIFNQWGELIFESADIKIGWNGYYKNILCQPDVYVWKVNVVFEDNENEHHQKTGTVTLLK